MRLPAFLEKILSSGAPRRAGEGVQFALMVLVMLGGGLSAFALILKLFLLPGRAAELSDQVKDYQSLQKFLDPSLSKQHYGLRDRVREAAKSQDDSGLRGAVESQLGPLSDKYNSFPSTVITSLSSSAAKKSGGGTFQHAQSITFKDAALQDLMDFVARVKQANPSVQVSEFTVNRVQRAGSASADPAADDRWSSTVTFNQFVTPSARPAKAPEPKAAEAAAAEAGVEQPVEAEKQ